MPKLALDSGSAPKRKEKTITATMNSRPDGFSSLFSQMLGVLDDVSSKDMWEDDLDGPGVVQCFMALADAEQKTQLVQKLQRRAGELVYDKAGCAVVQQILKEATGASLSNPSLEQAAIDFMTAAITARSDQKSEHEMIVRMMQHSHGNYVMQRFVGFLAKCQPTRRDSLLNTLLDAALWAAPQLAAQKQSCRVILRIFENFPDHNKVSQLRRCLLDSAQQLMKNEYGNYVVSGAVKKGDRSFCDGLARVACANFQMLLEANVIKFSSHAIRELARSPELSTQMYQCLARSFEETRRRLSKEVLRRQDLKTVLEEIEKDFPDASLRPQHSRQQEVYVAGVVY